MQYLGGKSRLAKSISQFLLERLNGRLFVEPFCGALNITAAMEPAGYRVASDLNPYLLKLYSALREGWSPPLEVSEEEYNRLKVALEVEPLTAFVGYGAAFGGKWFSGYARSTKNRNYAGGSARSLLRKFNRCRDVVFARCGYERLEVDAGCLVYCDPPYAATTGYRAVGGSFDSVSFWNVCRQWAKCGADVFVSEYTAPDDFRSAWRVESSELIGGGRNGETPKTVEHLFTWAGR